MTSIANMPPHDASSVQCNLAHQRFLRIPDQTLRRSLATGGKAEPDVARNLQKEGRDNDEAPGPLIVASTFFVVASVAAPVSASSAQVFTVTAYCQDGVTKSGSATHAGVAAGDPGYLPMGTVVRVHGGERAEARGDEGQSGETRPSVSGVYTVLDTGSKVTGRHLDLFMNDCNRAIRFGRQLLRVTILRWGWRPHLLVPHRP